MPGMRVSEVIERNIRFINAQNDEIGGTWQNGSLTWDDMSEWMQIVFQLPLTDYAPFPCLEDGDPGDPMTQLGTPINMSADNTSHIIRVGFYILLSPQGLPLDIPINTEMPPPRAFSQNLSNADPRNADFCKRVRARDGRCVITHTLPNHRFTAFESAHIFPLAHLDQWRTGSWVNQITDTEYVGQSGIHSVQNGLLLRSDIHHFFDSYDFAINPDKGYRTYCFSNLPSIDNRIMFRDINIPDKHQPCRALLKHHFRMTVLLNMKGRAGYPEWDEDIYGGEFDTIAEIANSEEGKLRFETVLAGRLNGLVA